MKVKDLLFTFDFKSLIKPHLYSEFKGHGSSGQIHVFRFRRVDGSLHPHISYKFWHQSSTWLPADGFSLRILSSRPDLRDPKQIQVSPYLSVVPATEIVFKKYQLLRRARFRLRFPIPVNFLLSPAGAAQRSCCVFRRASVQSARMPCSASGASCRPSSRVPWTSPFPTPDTLPRSAIGKSRRA